MADIFSALNRLLQQEDLSQPANQFQIEPEVMQPVVENNSAPQVQTAKPESQPNPYEEYKPNPIVNGFLQAMQFSPQLGNVASSMLSRSDQRVAQSKDLAQRYAESQQRQANEERRFKLDEDEAKNKRTTFEQGQQSLQDKKNPESDESKLAQATVLQMFGKDQNNPILKAAMAANGGKGVSADQAEAWVQTKGATWVKIYDQTAQNLRASMVNDRMMETNKLNREAADETRSQKLADKYATDFQSDMDVSKGRQGALGKTQETLNSIKRAEGVLQQFPDNNLPPSQVAELVEAWQRAISGGSGSEERIKRLLPETYKGDVNRFIQKFKGVPVGAGQQEFVKLIADSLQREKRINSDIINTERVQRAMSGKHEGYRQNFPDKFKSDLMNLEIDPETNIKEGRYVPSEEKPKEAQEKPKTVIQNGHTYTLNPETGQYE